MDENTKLETGQSSPIDDQGSPAVAVGSASQPEPTAAPTSAPSPEPSTVRAAPERAPLERPSPVRPPGRRSVPAPSGATAPARLASRLEGWPLAFLLIGLAIVGSCHYSALNLADSVGQGFKSISLSQIDRPSVGVLAVEGEIVASTWAVKILKEFEEDANIMAVVLRLDTPGGAVAPCQEIVETLRAMSKPVVVSMGSVAASGGLYLAMAGDHVMANPGTITGSIGVIMETIEVTGTMEKLGVKTEVITSGQFKDIGSPFRAMRVEERAMIQKMVMEVYEQFVAEVVKGRPKLQEAQVRLLADGRLFSGQEAVRVGLIDELGSLSKAIEKAVVMAKGSYDPKEDVPIVYEDGKSGLLQKLLSSTLGLSGPSSLFGRPGLKFLYRPGL